MERSENPIVRSFSMDEEESGTEGNVNGSDDIECQQQQQQQQQLQTSPFLLAQAAMIGMISGWVVAYFKLSVDFVRRCLYRSRFIVTQHHHPIWIILTALIPAMGGLAVGLLAIPSGFSPGLGGSVKEVDDEVNNNSINYSSSLGISLTINGGSAADSATSEQQPQPRALIPSYRPTRFIRKGAAAVFTLGSGCSLGPEGPAVELGMNLSRICMKLLPVGNDIPKSKLIRRNRLLLSCGAAAGVSAGFNAPLAGVFFALEIVQGAFSAANRESLLLSSTSAYRGNSEATSLSVALAGDSLIAGSATVTAILLSSVLSALVCKTILGDHLVLVLSEYNLKTPLMELPLYLLLGAACGLVAFIFNQTAKLSQALFDGKLGPKKLRICVKSTPKLFKPMLGGLFCGVVGLAYPQVLFFGYETLNSLLANHLFPTSFMLSLLVVKTVATAVSVGSGLVGGTFAPSLFLGALTGGTFRNTGTAILHMLLRLDPTLQWTELADVPAYAMIGAACVLAALFRAPLTGSLVLFELTRDYDVILPLMASAGVACVVCDYVDAILERQQKKPRWFLQQNAVSWGNLFDRTALLRRQKRRESTR